MVETRTFSAADIASDAPSGASLVLALRCDRPLAAPFVCRLADVDAVEVGRGGTATAERRPAGDPRRLRLDVDDPWMSTAHFRLVRAGGVWQVEDAGSKNGTLLNGLPAGRSELADRDLIEAGNAVFVFRAGGAAAPAADAPPSLRTLVPALAEAFAALGRVAPSKVPVLIRGETGTGKELIARAIHDRSGRDARFVAVNCAAIPDTLFEGELFGARKGAFSGALTDRPGLVRSAEGGTLFLDEVAELSPSAQGALLRVLQEGEVLALGDTVPVRVDFRVVAATNRELEKMMAAGEFRTDLYARLRGHEITLPPLRARREDLGLLCADLLQRIAGAGAANIKLHRGAARALFLHHWPLNVRELEQTLRSAAALAEGGPINPEHLPPELRPLAGLPAGRAAAAQGSDEEQRERLLELLRQFRGNLSAVARAMRTSRTQVRRLAQRLGVDLDTFR